MDSPIAIRRREANLSQHDFAILADIGLSTLVAIESGALKPNKKVFHALELIGVDVDEIELAQIHFIDTKRKAILAKIKGKFNNEAVAKS